MAARNKEKVAKVSHTNRVFDIKFLLNLIFFCFKLIFYFFWYVDIKNKIFKNKK